MAASSSSVAVPPSPPADEAATDEAAPREAADWDALDWLTLLFKGTPMGRGTGAVVCDFEADALLDGAAGLFELDLRKADEDLDDEDDALRWLLLDVDVDELVFAAPAVPAGFTTDVAFELLLLELLLLPPSSDFQKGILCVCPAALCYSILCCSVLAAMLLQ